MLERSTALAALSSIALGRETLNNVTALAAMAASRKRRRMRAQSGALKWRLPTSRDLKEVLVAASVCGFLTMRAQGVESHHLSYAP